MLWRYDNALNGEYTYGRDRISADITVKKGSNQRKTHTTTTMVMMRMMIKNGDIQYDD